MTDTPDEVIDSRPPDTPLQAARDLTQLAEELTARYPGLDVRIKDPLPEGLPGSDGELTGENPPPAAPAEPTARSGASSADTGSGAATSEPASSPASP